MSTRYVQKFKTVAAFKGTTPNLPSSAGIGTVGGTPYLNSTGGARALSFDFSPATRYFVNSVTGADTNDGLSWSTALATLTKAVSTAAVDDYIFLSPLHAETISAASGIALSKAGQTVVGMGNGKRRPTFTFSAVASTFDLSAANVTLYNVITTATAATTSMFSVTAAGVTLDTVDYFEGSGLPLQWLLTTAAADQLTICNCTHNAVTAGASAQIWIQLVGPDDTVIEDNKFYLVLNDAAGTYTIRASTACVRCHINRNLIVQLGGATMTAAISLVAASTGQVNDNMVSSIFTNIAGSIALASAYGGRNFANNTVNTNGLLEPVQDS